MKLFRLLASLIALAMMSGPVAADESGGESHFRDAGAGKVVFSRQERGELADILIDPEGTDDTARQDQEIVELLVTFEPGAERTWRAEESLEPNFETIFAATGARARLIGRRVMADERAYWFATAEFAPVVTALRRLPDPPGAAIAVLRSNLEMVNTLKPAQAELAANAPEAVR